MSDRMNEIERFGSSIASLQDAAADDAATLRAVRRRLLAADSTTQRASRLSLGAYALAGSLAAIGLLSLMHIVRARPIEVDDLSVVGTVDRGPYQAGTRTGTVRFADGTRVQLLPDARAHVDRIGQVGYRITLENGLAKASVVHRDDTRWNFDAGPFSVLVTGTQFDLSWDPVRSRVRLQVGQGSVVVSGCGLQDVPVGVGGAFEATCEGGRAQTIAGLAEAIPPARPSSESAGGDLPPAAASTGRPISEPVASSPFGIDDEVKSAPDAGVGPPETDAGMSWEEMARRGHWAQAYQAVSAQNFESECERASADGLLMLADAAGFSRRWDQAMHALLNLRRRHPGTSQACIASFRLGRLAFDQRGDMQAAAGWFRTYLQEGSAGGLEREAMGRLMECEQRQGHRQQARDLAGKYLQRFPNGPHAAVASAVLADP